MAQGRNISLFLMDGKPTGRIKCSLANWTGVAYKIPRTELDRVRDIAYLNQTGVYFLFGVSEESGDPVVYIGQAGSRKNGHGLLGRLDEHYRDSEKDYWTEAVAFTTQNNSFGPTEISYLENRFYNMAVNAGRYSVKNNLDPNPGNLTEEQERDMEEFITYSKLVMGALGYKVFEPIAEKSSSAPEDSPIDNEPLLYFSSSKAHATGKRTAEGFAVFAISQIALKLTPSCPKNIRQFREDYASKIDDQGRLLCDLLFQSPSAAASFVGGSSLSGNLKWKDASGKTLGDIEEEKVSPAAD